MNEDLLSEYTARNNAALRELVEKHNVQLKKLPDDVLSRLYEISEEMTAEIPGEDELAQRIYESYKNYRDSVVSYHEISERAFINVRAQNMKGSD